MGSSFLGILAVNFVLLLISFIAYSSQIFIIWPWYGSAISVELIALLLPFNFLVAMLLWNYYMCVVTDPGRVPPSWRPDTHSDGYEVKKLTGKPRHCRMCESYKPPRSHHCRQCNRCVLRMDHHCPWVNNCIGHFNHGHFIRFLFYVDVACSYHAVMVTRRVIDAAGARYWDQLSTVELVLIILNYVACIPVLMSVGIFSIYHFLGLLGNSTTIEGWEKDKVATMIRRGKIREVKFPYDLGRRKNIESVLGPNPLLWCCPTRTPGTGLKYEYTAGDEFDEAWPPRDKYETDLVLPESPWTFEGGSVNPDLRPSNSRIRETQSGQSRRRRPVGASALPPYHPDYTEPDIVYESSSEEDYVDSPRSFVRSGSEGYEVRQDNREEMLHRYLREIGEVPERYHRYIPEPDSEDDEDDDEPLGARIADNK
ncbi:palmitoyltransferase PFA4 [Mycena floridula]|nr:palmitoyltransferase PFA4 [Mycena floridula]